MVLLRCVDYIRGGDCDGGKKKKRERDRKKKFETSCITVHPTREPCDAMISPLRNVARSYMESLYVHAYVRKCTPAHVLDRLVYGPEKYSSRADRAARRFV